MELETPAPRPSRRRRAPSPKAADRDDAVVDVGPTRTKRRRLTLPEPGALHAELDPSSPALPSAGEGSPIATLSSDLLLHVLDWVGVLSKRALFIVVPAVCTRWQLACTAHVGNFDMVLDHFSRISFSWAFSRLLLGAHTRCACWMRVGAV